MTHFKYKKNILCAEDVPLERIAKKFGTPVYCYAATQIEDNFDAYDRALSRITDNYTICYAMKANSNQAVLSLLKKRGAGMDIVSGGELLRARKVGIPAKKIVYSGVGKNDMELEAAIKQNLLQINVESERELKTISRLAKKLGKTANIALRVNPDVDAKTHKKITTGTKENKFGIDIDDAPKFYDHAQKLPGINPCGVAVHIGSQLTSLTPYKNVYRRMAALVRRLRKDGHNITTVDLGGGIGIRYKDEKLLSLTAYAKVIKDIILPLKVHVIIEPGRSITGNAGVLISRVINVKRGKDKTFVIIDAAMNDLLRPTLYDAWHEVLPCKKTSARKMPCDVVGPVCETGDTFLTDEKLPPLKPGDLVAIMTSGAYGAVMASNYNTRPFCGEALVKGKKTALIRKTQTVQDIVKNDIIPRWIT